MADFKAGDVVSLKTGGQSMTVEKVSQDGVSVCWFHAHTPGAQELKRETLPAAVLVIAPETPAEAPAE